MPGREQRAGPGLPGGPPTGGPDGRVQALLAEPPLDHGQGHGRVPVVVDGGDQPGWPADQPRLDVRGHQQRHRPGSVGRAFQQGGLVREPGGQLDQLGIRPGWPGAGGVDGAHGSSFVYDPAAHGGAAAPGERRTRGPARAGGSPQRVGRAGRRAWGHAQDPFSLGVRRGSRPRAFRCGMATRRVPFRPPPVKPRALRRHLYRIATNPWRCGCRIGPVGWGGSAIFLPALKPTSPVVRPSRYPTSA
jgi:hypothetical protein